MATKNQSLWVPGSTGMLPGPQGPAGLQGPTGPKGADAPGDAWWQWINAPAGGVSCVVRLLSGGNVLQVMGVYRGDGTITPERNSKWLGWLPAGYVPQGVRQFSICRVQDSSYFNWRPAALAINWSASGLIEIVPIESDMVQAFFRTCTFSMYGLG